MSLLLLFRPSSPSVALLGDLGFTTVHPIGQVRHVDAVGLRREAVAQGTRVADAVGRSRSAVALGARTVEIL